MPKTHFSNHCQVLGELWLNYRNEAQTHSDWEQFFSWADIALPLSYMGWQGLATINPDAHQYIEDAWTTFCEMIDIDPSNSYDGIEAAWSASPNGRYLDVEIRNEKI